MTTMARRSRHPHVARVENGLILLRFARTSAGIQAHAATRSKSRIHCGTMTTTSGLIRIALVTCVCSGCSLAMSVRRQHRSDSGQHRRDRQQQRRVKQSIAVTAALVPALEGMERLRGPMARRGGTGADAEERVGPARPAEPCRRPRPVDARAGRVAGADEPRRGDSSRPRGHRGAGSVDGPAGADAPEPRRRGGAGRIPRSRRGAWSHNWRPWRRCRPA